MFFFLPAQGRAYVCFAQEFQRIMTVDLLLLVFVVLILSGRRPSFVIEAGRMAMACTRTGSEIPLYYFYHDGSDGDSSRKGGKEVDMGQESYGLDSWS
jgi:hypothetical protein